MTDLVAIALRAASFAAALQAAGIPIFLWIFGGGLARAVRPVGQLAGLAAAVGLLLTIGHALVEPSRLVGEFSGMLDASLQSLLLASDAGTAAAVRVMGLTMVIGGSMKSGRLSAIVALIGATLIAVSFAFMGHTATDERRWLLAAILILHLMLAAFWFGALWPLWMSTRRESMVVAGHVIDEFSRLAVWLVPFIFVAGLGLSIALVPDLAALGTPYGLLLLSKVAGFSLLMGLAALNKWRLGPRIARGDSGAVQVFGRVVLVEWVLIVAVVSVTATMTGLFSAH